MKVHEIIAALQDFPMDMDVECVHESSSWKWNGEHSEEVTTVSDGPVQSIESWTNECGNSVVRIS